MLSLWCHAWVISTAPCTSRQLIINISYTYAPQTYKIVSFLDEAEEDTSSATTCDM